MRTCRNKTNDQKAINLQLLMQLYFINFDIKLGSIFTKVENVDELGPNFKVFHLLRFR